MIIKIIYKNGKKYMRHVCVRSEREKLVKGCRLAFLDTRSDLRLPLFTRSRIRRNDLPHAGRPPPPLMCSMHWPTSLAPNNCCRSPLRRSQGTILAWKPLFRQYAALEQVSDRFAAVSIESSHHRLSLQIRKVGFI